MEYSFLNKYSFNIGVRENRKEIIVYFISFSLKILSRLEIIEI